MSKITGAKHPSGQEEAQQKAYIENNYRAEIARKLFHMTSLAFPVIYFFITKQLAVQILLPITLTILLLDIAKKFHQPSADVFYRTFGYILRQYERETQLKSLNGVTCFFIAASLATVFFPKYVTIMSFLMLTFSDTASALIGRRFGRTKIRGRSLEGGIAFVIVAVAVVLLTPKIEYRMGEYLICSVAAVVGAVAEILSGDTINDNIVIPLSIGASLWLSYFLVYPSMNIDKFGII
jgi:dolichol kinase